MDFYIPTPGDKKEEVISGVIDIFGKNNVKKTKKKNKKNKASTDPLVIETSEILMGTEEIFSEEAEKIIPKDIGALGMFTGIDGDTTKIIDGILTKQSRSYANRKNHVDKYKKEFAEELTLLYNMSKTNNEIVTLLHQAAKDAIKSSGNRVRGQLSMMQNNLLQSYNAALTNQLSITKELSTTKKISEDLALRKHSNDIKAGTLEKEGNNAMDAAAFMRMLNMSKETADMTQGVSMVDSMSAELGTYTAEQVMTNQPLVPPQYDNDDDIDHRLADRMSGGSFRSAEDTRRLVYDNQGAKIVIIRDSENDWYMEARMNDGTVIDDYPLPSKESLGGISFNGSKAKDKAGRMYELDDRTMHTDLGF